MVLPEDECENTMQHDISPIDGSDNIWDGAVDSADAPFLTSWVNDLGLTQADRGILCDGRCLTASHMSAACKLLRGQFPLQNGLIDTHILSHKEGYNSNPNKFVQIIFVSPNHWACLSNNMSKSGIVELYDSMHTTPMEGDSILSQACKIMQPLKLSTLIIQVVNVSVQKGGTDCGLHAIAMAMDLCSNVDPFAVDYVNDMRKQLRCCFEEGLLSQFQSEPSGRKDRVLKILSVNLYCVCRQPERGPMACCDECNTWYHPGCIYIPQEVIQDEDDLIPWSCPSCEFCQFSCTRKLKIILCRCFQQKDKELSIERKWIG